MDSSWISDTLLGRMAIWAAYDGPAALGNHLWQSTLFALGIAALVFALRRYSARLRHALWMVASLKFLVPFAALAMLGTQSPWRPAEEVSARAAPQALVVASELAAPLTPVADHWQLLLPRRDNPSRNRLFDYESLAALLALVWLLGSCFVAGRWLVRWRAVRRMLHGASATSGVAFPAPVRVTTQAIEPGIVGIFRPVLLLPRGIEECLTAEQMRAVLAHELCHLRRRDNLTAALHMLVEALFWFHPLVWWLGARLIDSRESACDEQVLREGHAPRSYGEAILRVCEHYMSSRLPCVSGVSGSDLRRRIERIMRRPFVARLTTSGKLLLAAGAIATVATPIAAGVASWRGAQGRSDYRDAMAQYWSVVRAGMASDRGYLCPGRSEELLDRQARLAGKVAGIAPGEGDRALFLAVLADSPEHTRRLLGTGATPIGDGFLLEDSLPHVAARFASPDVLQLLLEAGIDINGVANPLGGGSTGLNAQTPLMVAITAGRMDNVDWLIRHGADTGVVTGGGTSALSLAMVSCRDQELVTRLMRAGARPDDRAQRLAANMNFDLTASNSGDAALPSRDPAQTAATASILQETPYDVATRQAHDVRAAYLRGGQCPSPTDLRQEQNALRATVASLDAGDGEHVLRHAVMSRSEHDVRRLLAAGAARHADLMGVAARYADPPILQALADAGLRIRDSDGRTTSPLLVAASDGRADNVAWLLDHGADVNAGFGEGGTALTYAMPCRSQPLVDLLLRAGAKPSYAAREEAKTFRMDLSR